MTARQTGISTKTIEAIIKWVTITRATHFLVFIPVGPVCLYLLIIHLVFPGALINNKSIYVLHCFKFYIEDLSKTLI